ncbi:hypothetical protein BS47DRAFT_1462307 [Hydnum rufescens UP504]|uniref:Transposase n=1 Tax=Hydnum rufescens UP504 TaxID=1448309 RepID=A0A9P6ACT4_9AGAM|nr:hypothetical protein BS47DRAFT_1462307 [Hydnum rufescens UP504]
MTILGVILCSDETHLTNFSGDKSVHAVYMMLGNIRSSTCRKVSEARMVIDADGNTRRCVAILLAWIADLKEQYDIVALAPNSCPSCLATYDDLGSADPLPHHTAKSILDNIHKIRAMYPHADTWQFACQAKNIGLASVENICWEGLPIDICRIICVDNLHGLHKMFKDHLILWLSNTVGKPNSITDSWHSLIVWWSGKGHRDLERHIIPVIAGADGMIPGVMRSARLLLDFIYIAQFPMQSDSTLQALKAVLSTFHDNKESFIQNGSQTGASSIINHLNIPKLHALHCWLSNIPNLGSTDNYCTEMGETLHILMCKLAYQAMNRKDYEEQIIRYLIHQESLLLFRNYLCWRNQSMDLDNTHPEDSDAPPNPHPDAILLSDAGIRLAKRPHKVICSLNDVALQYDIPDFPASIARFVVENDNGSTRRPRYDYLGDVPAAF